MSQNRNTILAALRFYQNHNQGDPANRTDEIHDLATDDQDVSLDSDGVEELFEAIQSEKISIEEPATVCCKFCKKEVPEATAHLHDGDWVGEKCCWDERLRASE